MFPFSQRTGQIRVLSFKVGLVLLCKGHLEEKYRCEYDVPIIFVKLTFQVIAEFLFGKTYHYCVLSYVVL